MRTIRNQFSKYRLPMFRAIAMNQILNIRRYRVSEVSTGEDGALMSLLQILQTLSKQVIPAKTQLSFLGEKLHQKVISLTQQKPLTRCTTRNPMFHLLMQLIKIAMKVQNKTYG